MNQVFLDKCEIITDLKVPAIDILKMPPPERIEDGVTILGHISNLKPYFIIPGYKNVS